MQENIYKRLARTEALADAQRAEMTEVLTTAYNRACEDGNEEEAAELARKIRNKLLDSSDKEVAFDRLGIDTSSIAALFDSLKRVFSNEWAKYRQALRDLPQQKGFPLEVEFPKVPGSGDGEK